jgi:hypothetical protein
MPDEIRTIVEAAEAISPETNSLLSGFAISSPAVVNFWKIYTHDTNPEIR